MARCTRVVYRPFPTSNHNKHYGNNNNYQLYIVRFLHQTTTPLEPYSHKVRCISSVSYIKPQHFTSTKKGRFVVYRPFPTSNHNHGTKKTLPMTLYIVRFLHQTTTSVSSRLFFCSLYIVRFLHQTTTMPPKVMLSPGLYIVRFLHQTTTMVVECLSPMCCISSVSYIKPQPWKEEDLADDRCISSVSYIKPQPLVTLTAGHLSCISSVSYIKPQRKRFCITTQFCCISSVSYIKPQPLGRTTVSGTGCISSVSYIKPQLD